VSPLLSIESLDVDHGLLRAVRSVSLSVDEGEIVALVGANGAGKTSLLRAVAGANRASGGRIVFNGHDVTGLPAHRRVKAGVALVPEGRRLFADLSVAENLGVARDHGRPGPWDVEAIAEAFPLLRERLSRRAGNLSGGEQQATAIGRALITNPRLLLLDEISLGLAPVAVEDVYRSLARVIDRGTTIVLVEQDLGRAMSVAQRVVCMLEGRVVLEAATGDVTREQVTDAYFGLRRGETGATA
jgi:branched-chain amino acid transport system ATP-binding protein